MFIPGRACSTHRGDRILMGKPEGKRPLGRSRRRWDDHIKMDLRGIGWGGVGWNSSGTGWEPVSGSCEHGNEPSGSIKCSEIHE
jgi:hypothetical protein